MGVSQKEIVDWPENSYSQNQSRSQSRTFNEDSRKPEGAVRSMELWGGGQDFPNFCSLRKTLPVFCLAYTARTRTSPASVSFGFVLVRAPEFKFHFKLTWGREPRGPGAQYLIKLVNEFKDTYTSLWSSKHLRTITASLALENPALA